MTFLSHRKRLGLLALPLTLGATALLSGCGGVSTTTASYGAYSVNGPAVFGLSAAGILNSSIFVETSGAAPASGTGAIAVGAVASDALPITSEAGSTGTIPLGFAPGALYVDNATFGGAAHPGDAFTFGAYVANGLDAKGNFIAITGATITSTDLGIASQALTYSPNYNGPLANAQYRSASLTVPAGTTTGLKQLTVQVSDAAPGTAAHSPSTTTFDMVVLGGADSGVLAQIVDAGGAPVPGATATIDGADAPGYVGPGQTAGAATASVADDQGVVILFAPAGAHTVTVTSSDGTTTSTGTLAVTTTAGVLTNTTTDGTALTITVNAPAAAAVRHSAAMRRAMVHRHR